MTTTSPTEIHCNMPACSLRLLLAGLLASTACGEDERPPLVPIVPAATAAPPAVASSSSSTEPPPSPWSPALPPDARSVLHVQDMLAHPVSPGSHIVEAYLVARGGSCPPCPRNVVCSPCPPATWLLSDMPDLRAPALPLTEQPSRVTDGVRYRLRVESAASSSPTGAVRVVAVLARLTDPPGGAGDYDGCDACMSHRLEWGSAPGAGPTTTYALEPCRGVTVTRSGGAKPAACTAHLACSPLLLPYLESRMADHDLKAALARAPVVFGRDLRGRDPTMMRIAIDGREIFVGPPCGNDTGCVAPTAGVAQLVSDLSHSVVLTEDPVCGTN